ncbi:hypothetical protein CPT_Moonbeam197 [Bacillus phage Moonbeam]|uniref:Uncharacterized protein n=1 Tax=Bacillus phage Moonbeam TaxID=1540091 RepID=A0A0A0RNC1_9CAUD|nr:hypothetical protein CPT_Moonbeam197 [Bacillus phage Moonbeam]AIW03595.1 hypothetical protein CPT_Moonbeam197 [Bacillus phage Moonbeam]
MELFVTEKVFNRKLNGKAIRIKGYDTDGEKWDGVYLVKETRFDQIVVTSRTGNEHFIYMEEFETGELLTLIVLEGN